MKEIINKIQKKEYLIKLENKKFPILYLISSRHFRMPILPHFLFNKLF